MDNTNFFKTTSGDKDLFEKIGLICGEDPRYIKGLFESLMIFYTLEAYKAFEEKIPFSLQLPYLGEIKIESLDAKDFKIEFFLNDLGKSIITKIQNNNSTEIEAFLEKRIYRTIREKMGLIKT